MRAEHLYVHVPFCARRCVYCDFSIAVRSEVPIREFVNGIRRELDVRCLDASFDLETLYFGGGTPSKLGGDGIKEAIEVITEKARLRPGAEITIEANPEDVSRASASAWHQAGVNRVSLGVQSFNEGVLRWMHRTHDANQARKSIEVLREAGIRNVSIDLIFALPESTERSWDADLETAVAANVSHISAYGLTVEPHTLFGRQVARSDATEAPEENFEREFLAADKALVGAGFEHYEVSNYALKGLHSRHNWAYWNRRAYGGLGPSAHEFDGEARQWNVLPYAQWLQEVDRSGSAVAGRELLSEDEVIEEKIYLGLRTKSGLDLSADERTRIQPWLESGWAVMEGSRLRLTPSGWLRLDSLATSLTPSRSR